MLYAPLVNRSVGRAGTVAAGILLVLGGAVGFASAQGMDRWRTREGTLYFGTNPPPGSVRIEGSLRASPPVPPPSRARSASPRPDACGDQLALRLTRVLEAGPRKRIVGVIDHVGGVTVRDVRICAASDCARLEGGEAIAPGESITFSLDVPDSTDPVLVPRCRR